MKAALFFIASFFTVITQANAQYLRDVNGKPIRIGQYVDVQGSPYLSENWSAGSVRLAGDKALYDLQLKYDMVDDKLLFEAESGEPLEFVKSVIWFKISNSRQSVAKEEIYLNGFNLVDGNTEKTFYKLIADGGCKLLKKTRKKIRESKEYSSSVLVKSIEESSNYYLAKVDGSLARIKTDKKSITEALSDKSLDIAKFIKENNIDLKDDSGLAALLAYYTGEMP